MDQLRQMVIPSYLRPQQVPQDVEYALAHAALKDLESVPKGARQMVAVCGRMRNALAHSEPVSTANLQEFVSLAPSQFRGRWLPKP